MKKYTIATLDVWGNTKEGFEVNDVFKTSDCIELPENFTDNDVVKALKDVGYLNKSCQQRWINIDGDECLMFVEQASTWEPLFYLYLKED